ncbi:SAM-dependent methyltransferase, partial [Aminipila sp.]|uniref:SAM-dependent methyltransferase n=1 Tax=Aminipila sp. TaxID=2060095 RepID=UPI00289D1427
MARLYGLGVGPGDPELMTLKAVRIIEESDIIAVPKSGQSVNVAYTIAKGAIPGLDEKTIVELDMPMTR